MSHKEKIIGTIGIIIFIVFFYLISRDTKKFESNIREHKYQTICKVYRIETRRSFIHAYFYYYYNGLKYEAWENINFSGDNVINKFFKVDLSTENPAYSKIYFDQEVTDSTEIVKAGLKYERPLEE